MQRYSSHIARIARYGCRLGTAVPRAIRHYGRADGPMSDYSTIDQAFEPSTSATLGHRPTVGGDSPTSGRYSGLGGVVLIPPCLKCLNKGNEACAECDNGDCFADTYLAKKSRHDAFSTPQRATWILITLDIAGTVATMWNASVGQYMPFIMWLTYIQMRIAWLLEMYSEGQLALLRPTCI